MSIWPNPLSVTFLDQQEFREREEARSAQVEAYRARYPDLSYGDLWRTTDLKLAQLEFMPLGAMWEMPWCFDPFEDGAEEKAKRCLEAIQADPSKHYHLSIHYWRDWAPWRPPLSVICPDGRGWDIDSKSSNGDGWKITGTAPLISASPSIWTDMPNGYHGYLTDGVFKAC